MADDNNSDGKATPKAPNIDTSPAQTKAEAPRQTISISLSKKKKSKPTSAKLQLSTTEEEYSTIAEHAEALSKKRAEEGDVLVIPCNQTRDEGKPLLAQRSAANTQDVNTNRSEGNEEEDDEATRQLIQSATHREETESQATSGFTIAAPQQNTLNVKASTITKSAGTDDELFRRDLSSRADDVDPTSSTYANISIGDFGGALLRGMGWKGGDTSAKKEEEIKARPHRLGLGATPLLPPPTGKHGRARRPDELKKDEERVKMEQEREKKRLEMERLDVQFTLQRGSIVHLSDGGNRAKVMQTAGVPGLNRILVRMENGEEEAVNKGSVTLCSWEELESNPFKEKRSERDDGKEQLKHNGHKSSDVRQKESRSQDDCSDNDRNSRRKRKESSKNYSDDDSYRRRDGSSRNREHSDDDRYRKKKKSSHKKEFSDDDSSYERKRRRKESSRGRQNNDDDSYYERKRRKKESSRDMRNRKRDRSEERDSSRTHKSHRRDRHDREEGRQNKSSSNHQEHLNWLLPNIRVRLVSKKYPRQHLNKGIIQDVIPSQSSNPRAVILMDNQEVLDNVPERYLETALPKTGGNVVVLEGLHRWKKGRLLERSSEKGRGVIQLFENLEVVEVSLDGIAEWCAQLDEDME